jgi:hypothetical protein
MAFSTALSTAHELARTAHRWMVRSAPVAGLAAVGLVAAACTGVPKGAGSYMFTVVDAANGKPVEGVGISATVVGGASRGTPVRTGTTDEDGVAVLGFGNWGSVEVTLAEGEKTERWVVMQDRVAVNGGKASLEPLRMIVGSGAQGGVSSYRVSVTRVERGPKVDN